MTLQDLGSIGELLGGVAVVVSLIYLALQIRQNTETVRASTFQQAAASSSALAEQLSLDPELTRIFTSGVNELASLSEEDLPRFTFMGISFYRQLGNLHHQSRKGLINEEDWEGIRESYLRTISRPGMETWWQENSYRFNRHFRSFIDEELRRRAA